MYIYIYTYICIYVYNASAAGRLPLDGRRGRLRRGGGPGLREARGPHVSWSDIIIVIIIISININNDMIISFISSSSSSSIIIIIIIIIIIFMNVIINIMGCEKQRLGGPMCPGATLNSFQSTLNP